MNKIYTFPLVVVLLSLISGCSLGGTLSTAPSTNNNDTGQLLTAKDIVEDEIYLVQFHNGNYGLGVQRSANDRYIPYSLPYTNEGYDFMGWNVGGAAISGTTLDEFATIVGSFEIPYPKNESSPSTQNHFNLIDKGDSAIYVALRQRDGDNFSTTIKRYNLYNNSVVTLLNTGVLLYLYDIQGNYLLTHLGQRDNESNHRPPYDTILINTSTHKRYDLGPAMDIVINPRNPDADMVTYTRIFTKTKEEICQNNTPCTIGRDKVMNYDMLRTTDRLTDNLLYQ